MKPKSMSIISISARLLFQSEQLNDYLWQFKQQYFSSHEIRYSRLQTDKDSREDIGLMGFICNPPVLQLSWDIFVAAVVVVVVSLSSAEGAQTTRFVRSLLQSRNYRTKRSRSPITVTMDLPSLPPVSLAVHRRSFPFCPSQTVSIVSWRQSQIQTPERLYSKKGRGSKKRRERERDLLARLGLNVNCLALQQLCFNCRRLFLLLLLLFPCL